MSEDTAVATATPKAKTVYTPISMKDGRTVQFPGDTKMLKEKVKDSEGRITGWQIDFRNGETLSGDLNFGGLLADFAAHGALQKLGDEASGEKDIDDAFEAVHSLYDRLSRGIWSERASGGGFAGASLLLKAIAQAYRRTSEEARAFLSECTEGKSPKDAARIRDALRADDTIKPVYDRLQAEKLAASGAGINAKELLGRFTK
jgi:hypothetical protein